MSLEARMLVCLTSAMLAAACGGADDAVPAAAAGTKTPAVTSGPATADRTDQGVGSAASASAVAPAAAAPARVVATSAAPAQPPPPAAAPAVGTTTAAADTLDVERRRALIAWAIRQDEIRNDPAGQWAAQASASSTYRDAQPAAPYAATQATGAPDVEQYGSNGAAWAPNTADSGLEWLELRYARPVYATAVRIRESYGSGAVIKVELFDEQGRAHPVWAGNDATKDLNYLELEFPRTTFRTNRVRLTLATNVVRGWNQIDAVQLVGAAE